MLNRTLLLVPGSHAALALILASCGVEERPVSSPAGSISLFDEETTRVVLPEAVFSSSFEEAFASGKVWVTEPVASKDIHQTNLPAGGGKGVLWSGKTTFRPAGGNRRVLAEEAHDPQAGQTLPEDQPLAPRDLRVGEILVHGTGFSLCVPMRKDGVGDHPRMKVVSYETRTEDILSRVAGSTPEAGIVPRPRALTCRSETRRAVVVAAGTEITWRVQVPAGGRLALGYGTEAMGMRFRDGRLWLRQKPETTATFRVSLRTEAETQPRILWEGEVAPESAGRFFEADIDLAANGDQLVEISLSTSSPAGRNGAPPQTFPFWTEPILHGEWPSPPPNVIVLLLDTLRGDRLGCYGWERAQTPHLDALARRGVLFTCAWSAAPWTLPSHASLFSSLHSSEHGIWSPEQRLPEDHVTLAEVLRAFGYSTSAFTEGGYVQPTYGFGQGFDRFVVMRNGFHAAQTFGGAWESIREERTPFFCFVQTYEVHSPYKPPEDERERLVSPYSGDLPATVDTVDFPWGHGQAHDLDAADLKYMSDLYDAEIASVDAAIGVFIENLEVAGLMENTILIVTSDHGEEFGEHGHFAHGWSLYEEQLRVPLIIHGKGRFEGGLVLDHPVHGIDLAPTIVVAVGAEPAATWSGRAFSIDSSDDRPLFVPFRTRNIGTPAVAVMDGPLKYIEFDNRKRPGDPHSDSMLFNIEEDPGETTNLWSASLGKQWAEEVEKLRRRFPLAVDPDQPTVDEGINAQLRALGYIGDS